MWARKRTSTLRTAKTPLVRYGIDEYADTATLENHVHHSIPHVSDCGTKTMEEALSNDYAKEWKAAADSEYKLLMENEMRELVHGATL